ncbi:MAG: FRG domain-containing protein [Candidatus Poribacteria bacterium]|nr:FRG domain-containing protein [Candidatus Poribacteria bacterium]
MAEVGTLNGFVRWVENKIGKGCVFRGVPDRVKHKKIQASAYRRLPEWERDKPEKLRIVIEDLINEARLRKYDQKEGDTLFDLELLAELQHRGAATCLIDFTRNPLVALWFACQPKSTNRDEETDGKVFAVDSYDRSIEVVTPNLVKQKKIADFLTGDTLYKWEPALQNSRIFAQHSVFLFGSSKFPVVDVCVIPKKSKLAILSALEKFDIIELNIFPDYDGFIHRHAHDKSYTYPEYSNYFTRAFLARQQDNVDAAIGYFTKMLAITNIDASIRSQTHMHRGHAYFEIKDYINALKDFDRAIDIDPHPGLYFTRGQMRQHQAVGNYRGAIDDYNEAERLNPDIGVLTCLYRGMAWVALGKFDESKEDLEKAKELKVSVEGFFRWVGYKDIDGMEQKLEIDIPEEIKELLKRD